MAILRYGAGILDLRIYELKELDRKTQKLLIIHRGPHPPKSEWDRLYVSRKEGGRRLIIYESTIRSEQNNLGWFLNNSDESLLQVVKHV